MDLGPTTDGWRPLFLTRWHTADTTKTPAKPHLPLDLIISLRGIADKKYFSGTRIKQFGAYVDPPVGEYGCVLTLSYAYFMFRTEHQWLSAHWYHGIIGPEMLGGPQDNTKKLDLDEFENPQKVFDQRGAQP